MKVHGNLKIKTIYLNHYKNDHKQWMRGSIKRIEHAIHDDAVEFALESSNCTEEKEKKVKCTAEERKADLAQADVRYMSRRAELKSEVVGWSYRHLLNEYIKAGLELSLDYAITKSNFVQLPNYSGNMNINASKTI